MTISSAYIFGKQLTANDAPLDVVWFNSKTTSPMQSFGDNGNPYIKRNTTGGYWASFLKRDNSNYSEPAAGFIGCDATQVQLTDLPWELLITMLDSNEQETDYRMRYRAVNSYDNTITVYCEFGYMSQDHFSIIQDSTGFVSRDGTDQSLKFYLFAGAGAFLGNRAGNTLITDVTYTGVIAAGVNSGGTRFVDISGGACDLTKARNTYGVHLPPNRLDY